ncbi:PilZ domain-containing protein [Sphingomonas sp. ASV193]|uniref:PilZ domain-containing protein n=1 Tax=Sphingomonas sp. ASV193 TaxID=3144405 RepID=UPI0032E8CB5F
MNEQQVETTIYSFSQEPPAPDNRRESERHLTLFRVGSMTVGGHRELCLIKNISAGGMKLRVYSPVDPGETLTIELKCGQPIAGKVIWADSDSVGVAFDEPIDVIELLSASMNGPKPRMPRIATSTFATVREGASVYRFRACDISQGGMKLQSETVLPPNSDIVVTMSGLEPLPGVVRWCADGFVGITFNRLIPLAELVDWLQAQRASQAA